MDKYIKRQQGITIDGKVIECYVINPRHPDNKECGLDAWLNQLVKESKNG